MPDVSEKAGYCSEEGRIDFISKMRRLVNMRNPTIRQCISLLPRSLGTYVKKGKPLNHNFSALVILMVADDGFLRGLRKLI
jgi:hypothetical protein